MAKTLADLKKETLVENKVSKLSDLKTQPKTELPKESKESKSSKAESIFEDFVKLLQDGQPHTIKSLLDHFSLEATSSGREKLRACRRKINSTPESGVQIIETRIENAKAIQMIELTTDKAEVTE